MNNDELTNLIIQELSKHHDRQEIVRKICEASTLNWNDAEKLLAEIEAQNKKRIAARQGPFLIFVSVATLVIGLALLAYNMDLLLAIFHRDLLGQILGLRSGYYRLLGLVTGLAMTVGGFYGLWNVLASFFPDSK